MSAGGSGSPAFSRGGALALVAGGVALFLAVLYLIGSGERLVGDAALGQGHAAANGLNGFAGLVRLTEAQGYTVTRSRSPTGLRTSGLLVLAPPLGTDAGELAEILEARRSDGPTLVILPKWMAVPPPRNLPPSARDKYKRGWVDPGPAVASEWPAELPAPYTFTLATFETREDAPRARWSGLGLSGALASRAVLHAAPAGRHRTLIVDASGHALAFAVQPPGEDSDGQAYPVAFLAEPDLANNYGLADPARAAVTIALIDRLTDDKEIGDVTFDMTLNGLGGSENLLTLAFRPPFLAATLCLFAALLIVGWRAFLRFGPPAAPAGPDIAFGKRQLVVNGASLVVRARRFRLLAAPYAALSARRVAERLGLARPDPEAIDAALTRRLPQEEPFTRRAARLEAADKPAAILAAARALDDLATKLQQGPPTK